VNSNFLGFNIGTTASSTLLHIHDGGFAASPFTHYTNNVTGTGTLNGFKVGIASTSAADFMQQQAQPIRFWAQTAYRMQIAPTTGFVAIGNGFSTPAYRLDVNDNINVNSNTATSTTTNFINAGYRIGGNLVLAVPNDNLFII
jgi:hypothetical protein